MRVLVVILLMVVCTLGWSQSDSTTWHYSAYSLDLGYPADLGQSLLSRESDEGFFKEFDTAFPSLSVLHGDSSHFSFLSLRGMINRKKSSTEVPTVNANNQEILGGISIEERLISELLLDIEMGYQFVKYKRGFHLSAGLGAYVTVARSKAELRTDNDLAAYVGESISLTTRTRGEFGPRLRIELGKRLNSCFTVAISGSYQAGLRFLPDVSSLRVSQQSDGQIALNRVNESRGSTSWIWADQLVPQLSIRFNTKGILK